MRPPAPVAEIRLVEIGGGGGGWHLRENSCGNAFFQYTVWRPQNVDVHFNISSVFGIPLRLSCIHGAHGDYSVTRSAGLDKIFGTPDDSCWTSNVTCDELVRAESARLEKMILENKLDVEPAQPKPKAKPKTKTKTKTKLVEKPAPPPS